MKNIFLRSFIVWVVFICAEIVNGTFREFFLIPYLGNAISEIISLFIGSFIILFIAYVFIDWIGAKEKISFLKVGLTWLFLTLIFEFSFGYYVIGRTMDEIIQDMNIFNGSLFPYGLIFMTFVPFLAYKIKNRIIS